MERGARIPKARSGTSALLLMAALFVSFAASAACEKIAVTGAGYSLCNGTYLRGGESYGRPVYATADYRIVWQGSWYLADFVGGTYYMNESSAAEPPATGWVSLLPEDDPAPTLSCSDAAPPAEVSGPEPKIVGRSYGLQGGSLTLVFENVGSASVTVYELCAGPAVSTAGADGTVLFWIPDSDLWLVLALDQVYVVEPGATLTLVLPSPGLLPGWLEEAAARSALFTGLTFSAPHIAVGVLGSPTSWIHLVPEWLEQREAAGS